VSNINDNLTRQRKVIKAMGVFGNPNMHLTITLGDLQGLIEKIDKLEAENYAAWENSMGEDL